jgi:hypothetical protein
MTQPECVICRLVLPSLAEGFDRVYRVRLTVEGHFELRPQNEN